MKFTHFGHEVRILRMKYDRSLKSMADFLEISSSHLSGIEHGDKSLNEKLIQRTSEFFGPVATPAELSALRAAGEKSLEVLNLKEGFDDDTRAKVARFARRLREGRPLPKQVSDFLDTVCEE